MSMWLSVALFVGIYLQIHRIFDIPVTSHVSPCLPVCLLVRQGGADSRFFKRGICGWLLSFRTKAMKKEEKEVACCQNQDEKNQPLGLRTLQTEF